MRAPSCGGRPRRDGEARQAAADRRPIGGLEATRGRGQGTTEVRPRAKASVVGGLQYHRRSAGAPLPLARDDARGARSMHGRGTSGGSSAREERAASDGVCTRCSAPGRCAGVDLASIVRTERAATKCKAREPFGRQRKGSRGEQPWSEAPELDVLSPGEVRDSRSDSWPTQIPAWPGRPGLPGTQSPIVGARPAVGFVRVP